MADEKTTLLIDVQVSASEALKRQEELKVSLQQQKEVLKQLEVEQGKTSQAYIAQEATVKNLNNQLAANGRVLTQMAGTATTASGAYAELNQRSAQAAQRAKDLAAAYGMGDERAKAAAKEAKALSDQLKEVDSSVGQNQRRVGDYAGELGKLSGSLNSVYPGLGNFATGMGAMTKSAIAFIATPIGAVIAALGLAISALTSYFKGSEEGANNFAKISGILSSVLGNLSDIVQKVGKYIFEAFSNPKKTLEDFGNLLKDQIVNRITGMLELLPALGKAISLAFKGEFKEAGQIAGNALGKVTLGVDNVVEKFGKAGEAIKKFGEEVSKDGELAVKVAKMRADAEKLERKLIDDRALMEANISELRLKAREQEKYSAAERKKFLIEAQNLQGKLGSQEKQVASLRYEALKLENTLSNTTVENLKKESELKAAVSQSDIKMNNEKKAMLREMNKINKELEKSGEELAAANAKRTEAEIKAFDEAQKEMIASREAALKAVNDLQFGIEEEPEVDTGSAVQYQKDLEAAKQLIRESSDLAYLDYQQELLDKEYQAAIENANKIGADTTAIEAAYVETKKKLNQAEISAKMDMASSFAGNLSEIFGKNTKIGKMAAAAQIAIDTAKGAMAAYTSTASIPVVGPALGVVAAGAVIAKGARSIKDVWAVKSGLKGDSGGGGASVSTSAASGGMPASVTGALVSRNSGQVQQAATSQAVEAALKANPVQPVLVTNDLTTALDQKVQIKSDNSL